MTKQSRVTTLIGAGAMALGALMAATAPTANAEKIPENTIRHECQDVGGTYNTVVKGSKSIGFTRFSTCTYRDSKGTQYTDYYADGEWYGENPTGGAGPVPA